MKMLLGTVAVLALSATSAIADQPNGYFVNNDNYSNNQKGQGVLCSVYSAQIIQNGQFVGGNKFSFLGYGIDQTTAPRSRLDGLNKCNPGLENDPPLP